MAHDLNPYTAPTATHPKGSFGNGLMTRGIAIMLLASIPSCVALESLKNNLLETRVLNTKDLPPLVGNESGTVSEYLLNIWHWDAATMVFGILCIPCTIIGVYLMGWTKTKLKPIAR